MSEPIPPANLALIGSILLRLVDATLRLQREVEDLRTAVEANGVAIERIGRSLGIEPESEEEDDSPGHKN